MVVSIIIKINFNSNKINALFSDQQSQTSAAPLDLSVRSKKINERSLSEKGDREKSESPENIICAPSLPGNYALQ